MRSLTIIFRDQYKKVNNIQDNIKKVVDDKVKIRNDTIYHELENISD